MWRLLGWTALCGSAVTLILALLSLDRANRGPYGEVLPAMSYPPPSEVPPEWKWTLRIVALLWFLASCVLVVLGSYLLPGVGWLERFRIFGH